ncbi:MAG: hypothetical protein HYX60_00440, partial [Legionella longbeachae]|nr:hypothetical protein [Legionella longbeachae]
LSLLQEQRQRAVTLEFAKGGQANLNVILKSLSAGIDLQANCGFSYLTFAEQAIAQAYVSNKNLELLKEVYDIIQKAKLPINIEKIAGTWKTHRQQDAYHWLNSNIKKIQEEQRQQLLINEFKKGPSADLHVIFNVLSQGIDWQAPCLYGLTFAEQAIAQAYNSKNFNLLKLAYAATSGSSFDVNKITKSFQPNLQKEVSTWINSNVKTLQEEQRQQLLINEFKKGTSADLNVIFNVLSQGINWQAPCMCGLTFAEQGIAQAYKSKNFDLLKLAYAATPGSSFDPNKIIRTFDSNLQQHVSNWMNSNIATIQKEQRQQLLINEFKKGTSADPNVIFNILSNAINWHDPCMYGLTFAEQTIAHAFNSKNFPLLKLVYYSTQENGFSSFSVNNIINSFNNYNTQQEAREWIIKGIDCIQQDELQNKRYPGFSTY